MKHLGTLTTSIIVGLLGSQLALAQPGSDRGTDEKAPGRKGLPAATGTPAERPKRGHETPRDLRKEGLRPGGQADDKRADPERDRTGKTPAVHGKYSDKFRGKLKQLRDSRDKRRQQHRSALKKKWGDLSERPPVMAEFKTHAWRMARLKRMQLLAEELEKPQLLERVNKLIEQEVARHDKHLEKLKATGPKTAAPEADQGKAVTDAKPDPAALPKPDLPKPEVPKPEPAKSAEKE
jgi:hypothetical protein